MNKGPDKGRSAPVGEILTGVFQSARHGGFVLLERADYADVRIEGDDTGAALHGDQVRVKITSHPRGKSPCGVIERVLRHANKQILGQIQRSGRFCVVRPMNDKIRRLIEIRRQFDPAEVPDGAWVMVEVVKWSDNPREPLPGRLVEVIGTEGDRRLPVLLLLRGGGVNPAFPDEVESEAGAMVRRGVSEDELARRRDFRSDRVFTIDPATAKDFDDAVSLIGRTADGGWRVGVHIADVAHYVTPGSATDAEAFDRATSIYPVDRVIPMLPEALSNQLCSLRPGEMKLTMSALFDVTPQGDVRNSELCESVIFSARRFTYDEVQGLFDRCDEVEDSARPCPTIPDALLDDLLQVRAAGRALLDERTRRGALDLELPETEVIFGADGEVTDLRRKEHWESHRLIEGLMIAANEAVARTLRKLKIPTLYRVHEPPDPEKLEALAPAFGRFGISLPKQGVTDQAELQAAICKAREHPAARIIQRLVLRSMKRARYEPRNLGHFGLASECYLHFTSPIRRYPDLVVHRGVKLLLGGRSERDAAISGMEGALPESGTHCSAREERAQKIEWDAINLLSLEFMKRFIGDVFDGFVAGMINKGFFVELIEYPAEGFVALKTIEEDFFDLDPSGVEMRGRSSGRLISLGDRVRVQIMRINVLAGEMDLALLPPSGARRSAEEKKKRPAGGSKKYNWRKHVRAKKGRPGRNR